jgi:predicted O-methyltransferase YrrM
MVQALQKIYETGQVTGASGKVHELRDAIDPRESKFLTGILRQDSSISKTLEIGCACGMSSLTICEALKGRPNASHTIIDPNQSTEWDGIGIRNLREAGINFFKLIEEKSELALPKLLEKKEKAFDLIFVDGWHTFDHTLLDCFYATRLLRPGGILVVDDTHLAAVKRVMDFLKTYPCYEEYGFVKAGSTQPLKRAIKDIVKPLLSPIPRRIWVNLFGNRFYQKAFEDPRMVALKKVVEDKRAWNWHDDNF